MFVSKVTESVRASQGIGLLFDLIFIISFC